MTIPNGRASIKIPLWEDGKSKAIRDRHACFQQAHEDSYGGDCHVASLLTKTPPSLPISPAPRLSDTPALFSVSSVV